MPRRLCGADRRPLVSSCDVRDGAGAGGGLPRAHPVRVVGERAAGAGRFHDRAFERPRGGLRPRREPRLLREAEVPRRAPIPKIPVLAKTGSRSPRRDTSDDRQNGAAADGRCRKRDSRAAFRLRHRVGERGANLASLINPVKSPKRLNS